MRRKTIWLILSVLCIILTGCGKTSGETEKPLLGLVWFTSYDDVKKDFSEYTLVNERENDTNSAQHQRMMDYSDVMLYDMSCDLTLCFTDSGLIGLNYHDVKRNQRYHEWYETLEVNYGLPTEQGSGMASWYDNPLGKDTSIYLFNSADGVQISFYATADSPDQGYENQRPVPEPELWAPIVPADDDTVQKTTESTAITGSDDRAAHTNLREGSNGVTVNGELVLGSDDEGNLVLAVTDVRGDYDTDIAGETMTTVISVITDAVRTDENGKTVTTAKSVNTGTTRTTTVTTKAVTEETKPKKDNTKAFLLNGLNFYGSPDEERKKMSRYSQLYEELYEDPGLPWELVVEYENVPYLGINCNSVLCFTSLGLVGINYFDENLSDVSKWQTELTQIYGNPDEIQYDYCVWKDAVGKNTMIYLFVLEDGLQISFYADDTGSEIS